MTGPTSRPAPTASSGASPKPSADHWANTRATAGRGNRFWTATRIVLALACLTLALHWVQKSPCQDGAWQNNVQYTQFCYTDVLALYYAEGLNEGKVPYRDHPVEYPVVTGYFMGAIGLPVHAVGDANPQINQVQWFYNINALVLSRARRRHGGGDPGAAPPTTLGRGALRARARAGADRHRQLGLPRHRTRRRSVYYAWARRRPVLAGVLLGLAGAAKMWPLFILGPILVLALRAQRLRAALIALGSALATVFVVNLPVAVLYPGELGAVLRAEHHARRSTGARSGTSAATSTARSTAARSATRARSSGSAPTSPR